MLRLLDVLFFWLHIFIITFNLFGWIWEKTRKWHLLVVGITLFSWIILGIKYGFGYCFVTDWHWQIKQKLGETDLPASFIKYFFDRYTSFHWSAATIDLITGISFFLAIACSVYMNFFKRKTNQATDLKNH